MRVYKINDYIEIISKQARERAGLSEQQILQHGNKTNVSEVSNPHNTSEVIQSQIIPGG